MCTDVERERQMHMYAAAHVTCKIMYMYPRQQAGSEISQSRFETWQLRGRDVVVTAVLGKPAESSWLS